MAAASYKVTAILFGVSVTLHNLEEALFLASWSRCHLKLWFTPNHKIYSVLTLLVSVVVWIPVVGISAWSENARLQAALAGFALAMVVNAIFPHLLLSLATRSYSPGAGTGMLLNLPLGIWLIHEQRKAQVLVDVWRQAVPCAVLLAVGAFGSLLAAHAILAWRSHD
jgi:Na+(H+)/acetate symporter ActP